MIEAKREKGKFNRFIEMLRELILIIPLIEVLEKISKYARFIKQFARNKKVTMIEDVDSLHHYSAVTMRSLAQKRVTPIVLTIPCTIGSSQFVRSLVHL